jgi:hypothetical protein
VIFFASRSWDKAFLLLGGLGCISLGFLLRKRPKSTREEQQPKAAKGITGAEADLEGKRD